LSANSDRPFPKRSQIEKSNKTILGENQMTTLITGTQIKLEKMGFIKCPAPSIDRRSEGERQLDFARSIVGETVEKREDKAFLISEKLEIDFVYEDENTIICYARVNDNYYSYLCKNAQTLQVVINNLLKDFPDLRIGKANSFTREYHGNDFYHYPCQVLAGWLKIQSRFPDWSTQWATGQKPTDRTPELIVIDIMFRNVVGKSVKGVKVIAS
jgi:hypothetical protein